jgi:poly(3-hydroxybutyrate) depolymerase
MRYQFYQAQLDLATPFRDAARFTAAMLKGFETPGIEGFLPRTAAAALEMAAVPPTTHVRPPFGIATIAIDGAEIAVTEEVVDATPFCQLLHFRKNTVTPGPKLMVVAPMSGHFSTLLRGTVQTLLTDHDVFITDWQNARDVPRSAGTFDFDDFIAHVMRFQTHLGPTAHILAVCQPATPVLAAVSLMAANNDPDQPASMILMGGPIHPSAAPTSVSELAGKHPLSWFASHMIETVPRQFQGGGRRVYPGFLQLASFLAMNPDRHAQSFLQQFNNLVSGDEDSAAAHRSFYSEYTAVMDMPAEFYLQTIKTVFQEEDLAHGTMVWRGQKVDPSAIKRTALYTVSGELDDICAHGQTRAAQDLCSGLPASKKLDMLQMGAGHYGIFNGRRWREQVYPTIRDFIARHAVKAANDAAPVEELAATAS